MNTERTIAIASEFSRFPGGRYRADGEHSGEAFRDDLLIPALRSNQTVTVILDGAAGYPSSFLEEAFGGMVRLGKLRKDDLNRRLFIVADSHYRTYKLLAERYIREANPETAMVA